MPSSKSGLPSTTPHRRKKTATKKTADGRHDDYCSSGSGASSTSLSTATPHCRKKEVAKKTAADCQGNDYHFGEPTTTPHRRKKSVKTRERIDDEYTDYCYGEFSVAAESTTSARKNDRTTKKESKTSSSGEKENAPNGETSRRKKLDEAKQRSRSRECESFDDGMNQIEAGMARVHIGKTNNNSLSAKDAKQKYEIRQIEFPTCSLPKLSFTSPTNRSDFSKSLSLIKKKIDAKLFTSPLIEKISETAYNLKPSPSILLEENSAGLRNAVKSCVKAASSALSQQGQAEAEGGVHLLRVAIHILRGILHTYYENAQGMGIKLAFHCVVLSHEGMLASLRQLEDANANKSKCREDTKHKLNKEMVEWGILCLAAYECLIHLLGHNSWLLSSTVCNALPERQMLKICIESGSCAASVLMHLCGDIPNEFAFVEQIDRNLFQGILMSTLPLLQCMHGLDEMEAMKQGKKIFRLVSDGARSLESLSDTTCLQLQCLAVAMLSRFVTEAFPTTKERKELLSLWDRASFSALKAAAAFEKLLATNDSREMKSSLTEFHKVAGGMLDNVYIQVDNAGSGALAPAAYFEYCVYRSIHEWKMLHSVESIHTPDGLIRGKTVKCNSGDGDTLAAVATLSVVILGLEARVAITSTDKLSSLANFDAIIAFFDHVVIRNASTASQTRCRAMIMQLNLQREASKIIASNQSASSGHSYLSTMGYILGRCMAPLEKRIARSIDDPQRCLNFRLSASDNHAKSASFFDAAMDDSVAYELCEKWNGECAWQVRKAFEILSTVTEESKRGMESGSPEVLAVEVFAKAAASIGRKCFDRKDMASSIECQAYATELLTRLALRGFSAGLFEKYQISTRYMLLASALEANGNIEESCAALALAVWGASKNNASAFSSDENGNSFASDTVSEEILLFPGSVIFENQPDSESKSFTDGLPVMINKLARANIEVFKAHRKVKSNAIPRDSMLSSLMKTNCSLSSLLDFIVWSDGNLEVAQILELIRELLKCSSKVLRCSLNDADIDSEKVSSAMVKELDQFLIIQVDRLKSLLSSEDMQVVSSALHVWFAMHLADSHMLRFPKTYTSLRSNDVTKNVQIELLGHSLYQLQQSEKLFAMAAEDSGCIHDVCFFAQRAAVHLHQSILLEHQLSHNQSGDCHDVTSREPAANTMQQYSHVLDICNRAIYQLVDTDEDVPREVLESLILTLKRLLCRFILHADPVSSSQCYAYLQKIYTLDVQVHMFDSVSDFLWLSSKFDDLAAYLIRNCTFDSTQPAKCLLGDAVQQLNQNGQIDVISDCIVDVMVATSSELTKAHTENLRANVIEESLQHISEFIESNLSSMEFDPSCDEIDLNAMCAILQIQTFVVTVLMLLSKMFINAGRPESSIKSLNSCRIECKRMTTLLRRFSGFLRNPLFDDKLIQVDDLLSMGLERMSIAFSSFGIRRKAEDSACLAVVKQKMVGLEVTNMNKITFKELIANAERLDGMYNFLPSIRTLIRIKSMSAAPDKLSKESRLFDNFDFSTPSQCSSITGVLNRSQSLLTYDDAFRHASDFKTQCDGFLLLAHETIVSCTNQLLESETSSVVPLSSFVTPTELELKLRLSLHNKPSTTGVLEKIVSSGNSTPSCIVNAYYSMGLEALEKARSSKELHKLWRDHVVVAGEDEFCEGNDDLSVLHSVQARKYFQCALLHANPASANNTKNILRCLALVTGPSHMAAFYTHASIGGAARNILRDLMSDGSGESHHSSKLFNIFNVIDDERLSMEARSEAFSNLLAEYSLIIPTNWTISAVATCPTGEILITSLRASHEGKPSLETICILTSSNEGSVKVQKPNFHDDILSPLDSLIDRSQKQLRGIDEETQNEKYDDELSKRKWWNERHSIDEDLHSLLNHAEHTYFGQKIVRPMFLSTFTDDDCFSSDDDSSDCSYFGPGNLASRFEEAEREPIQDFDEDAERSTLKKLTVANLKEKLNAFGVEDTRLKNMRKAELIDLVIVEMGNNSQRKPASVETQLSRDETASCDPDEPCTILILDEHLHRLPLESMDMFANRAVCRMPSLPFVIAALEERRSTGMTSLALQVDPNKLKFILDPEQNLSETASTMNPALESMSLSNGWDWKGCVGEMPTPEFMTEALTQDNGLVLYCGHGGGEKFFSRAQVEDFINHHSGDTVDTRRGCRSVVVLMGCSSGKLKSVNHPEDNPSKPYYPIHYEPEGIALSYIFAGAPCVVGNLWDVTDRDIDRYCLTLLEDFFHHSEENSFAPSLAKCVASARRACKLRYIVGSAPVCYGIPVQCSHRFQTFN